MEIRVGLRMSGSLCLLERACVFASVCPRERSQNARHVPRVTGTMKMMNFMLSGHTDSVRRSSGHKREGRRSLVVCGSSKVSTVLFH